MRLPLNVESIPFSKVKVHHDISAGILTEDKPVSPQIAEQNVVAEIPVNCVVALTSEQSVVALAAKQIVVSEIPINHIIAEVAINDVVALSTINRVVDRTSEKRALIKIPVNYVRPQIAINDIVIGSACQNVIPRTAHQGVVAGKALYVIFAVSADNHVRNILAEIEGTSVLAARRDVLY